mgnify:CR=1 FL=1
MDSKEAFLKAIGTGIDAKASSYDFSKSNTISLYDGSFWKLEHHTVCDFPDYLRVFAINACNKKKYHLHLSITSQAFTLHLPYVLLFRNEDCFMTAYAHLLLYFFFYSFVGWIWESSYVSILTKRLTNRGFFNWSNASDLWNRRCSHALCHLPSAIV